MANNRMYLRCPICPEAEPLMLAKYFPSVGWYAFGDDDGSNSVHDRIDAFFTRHRHDSQWGNGFVLEYEICPDATMESPVKFEVSKTEPFPPINTSDSDSTNR